MLDILIKAQIHLVIVILALTCILWFLCWKQGIFAIFRKSYLVSIVIGIGLIFVLNAFVSEVYIDSLRSGLILVLSLIMLCIISGEDRSEKKKRKGELGGLMEPKKEHPIQLEFARVIVQPEIDKLKSIEKKNIRDHKKRIKEFERLEAGITAEREKLESQENALEKKFKEIEIKNEKLRLDKEELKFLKKGLEKDNLKLTDEKEDFEDLKDQLIEEEKSIKKDREKLEKAKEKWKERADELLDFEDGLKQKEIELDDQKSELTKVKDTKNKLDKQYNFFRGKLKDFEKEKGNFKHKQRDFLKEKEKLEDERDEFKDEKIRLEHRKSKFSKSLDEIKEKEAKLKKLEDTINIKKKELETMEKKFEEIEQDFEGDAIDLHEFEVLKDKLKQQEKELADYKERIKILQKTIEAGKL